MLFMKCTFVLGRKLSTVNIVLQIAHTAKKGQAPTFVDEAVLVQEQGIEKDYHSGCGDGLLVIVHKALVDWMEKRPQKGLCFKRFRYNLCLSHSISHFESGRAFGLGEAVVTVDAKRKKCFAADGACCIPDGECMLHSDVVFANVTKTGSVAVNQSLILCSKA